VGHARFAQAASFMCAPFATTDIDIARVLKAMYDQGRELSFTGVRVSRHKSNDELSRRVAELAGPGFERCHFVSDGSEAVKMAIKFPRQYAFAKVRKDKTKVVSCLSSYQGGTLATRGITGDVDYAMVYGDMAVFSEEIPARLTYRIAAGVSREEAAKQAGERLDETIRKLGADNVLAFIFEPAGGLATGALVPHDAWFREVRRVCSAHGVWLVFDEVMWACRPGTFLAAHHWPDGKPD